MKNNINKNSTPSRAADIIKHKRQRRDPSLIIDRLPGAQSSIGYRSESLATMEGRSYSHAAGSEHDNRSRSNSTKEARDFGRNNGLFKGPRERALEYAIGSGFKLIMLSKDNDYNKSVMQLWQEYWTKPETKGLTGWQTEYMWLREHYTVGDVAANKVSNGKLQLIESEQIVTPKNRRATDGIVKSRLGEPLAFWVAPYVKGYVRTDRAKRIPAQEILFLTDPDRISSFRTAPPLQDAFPVLRRVKDVIDAEALAAQIMSRITFMLNTEHAPSFGKEMSVDDPDKSSADMEDDLARRLVELDYALIFFGKPGDEIKGLDRNIPGKDFSQNIRMFLQIYGVSWGLPLEIVLLDWTKSNYSQMRGAIDMVYKVMLRKQCLLSDTLLNPTLEWKIRLWQKQKKIPIIEDGFAHDWIVPNKPAYDDAKDAQAWGIKLDRGLTTLAMALKSQNKDPEQFYKARAEEWQKAIDISKKLYEDNKEYLDQTGQIIPLAPFAGMKYVPERGRPGGAAPAAGAEARPADPEKKNKGIEK